MGERRLQDDLCMRSTDYRMMCMGEHRLQCVLCMWEHRLQDDLCMGESILQDDLCEAHLQKSKYTGKRQHIFFRRFIITRTCGPSYSACSQA